jgi:hypothetical protein
MAIMKVGPAGIETMSGALKKPKKMNGHNHGNYLVATHRTAATENPNCQRVYSFDGDRYKRSSAPTVNELFVRQRFSAVSAAVKARQEDMTKIDADIAAFNAQKDTADGKKTMNAYLWSLECAAYDEAHPRG